MAVLKRYMSKKQICDILVIAPKAKKKRGDKSQQLMSPQYVQYSKENICNYMMTASFTYFTNPLKMNQLEPVAALKTTSI